MSWDSGMYRHRMASNQKPFPLIVVTGDGPSLLGRNWLQHLCLDWKKIGKSPAGQAQRRIESLLAKHTAIFRGKLGTIQPFQATLRVKENATPRFYKARSVLFAIKEAIELELNRLEGVGILKKVNYSEWAAPIVAVPKKDGGIRICGDYKVIVNQELEVDQYPLLKPEELFATLAAGKKFTKLDMSQAYQQLVLNEESTKYRNSLFSSQKYFPLRKKD